MLSSFAECVCLFLWLGWRLDGGLWGIKAKMQALEFTKTLARICSNIAYIVNRVPTFFPLINLEERKNTASTCWGPPTFVNMFICLRTKITLIFFFNRLQNGQQLDPLFFVLHISKMVSSGQGSDEAKKWREKGRQNWKRRNGQALMYLIMAENVLSSYRISKCTSNRRRVIVFGSQGNIIGEKEAGQESRWEREREEEVRSSFQKQ